ncbi:hypothetical protein [Streptomyces erythrochromogenes]|uniref:hypothetical protein n=1 Tax=Streptomyces erythrochromogenes TaxID=285574 RepID=UPI00386317D0|nr:hypothetical protein OG364_10920 [Streptomyces erythrochromogenes]
MSTCPRRADRPSWGRRPYCGETPGEVELPLGVLAEAGLGPGSKIVAYSAGDGRIVLRRTEDAVAELMETGDLS